MGNYVRSSRLLIDFLLFFYLLFSICIIAADISPIDVITHLPVLCEEANIPYIYVPTKQALGAASSTKRPTSCVLITCNNDSSYKDAYDACSASIKESHAE